MLATVRYSPVSAIDEEPQAFNIIPNFTTKINIEFYKIKSKFISIINFHNLPSFVRLESPINELIGFILIHVFSILQAFQINFHVNYFIHFIQLKKTVTTIIRKYSLSVPHINLIVFDLSWNLINGLLSLTILSPIFQDLYIYIYIYVYISPSSNPYTDKEPKEANFLQYLKCIPNSKALNHQKRAPRFEF